MHSPSSDQRHEVATVLNSVAVRLLRRVREADRETGLTAPRASLMSVLVFGGARTIGQLAESEQVTQPAVTKMVDALEASGLVERRRLASDRRTVEVHATARGRQALERGRAARVRILADLLADLPDGELATVGQAAAALARLV